MIDYEKLKLAHKLTLKLHHGRLVVDAINDYQAIKYELYWYFPRKLEYFTESLDELILKLKEITGGEFCK